MAAKASMGSSESAKSSATLSSRPSKRGDSVSQALISKAKAAEVDHAPPPSRGSITAAARNAPSGVQPETAAACEATASAASAPSAHQSRKTPPFTGSTPAPCNCGTSAPPKNSKSTYSRCTPFNHSAGSLQPTSRSTSAPPSRAGMTSSALCTVLRVRHGCGGRGRTETTRRQG